MKRPSNIINAALITGALLLVTFVGSSGASAAEPESAAGNTEVPSLWREYKDYFVMGTFGGWSDPQQIKHYRTSSPGNDLKLDSQIGGNWRNGTSPSAVAYKDSVAAINADDTLSEQQKSEKIEEANEQIILQENTNGEKILAAIQEYNAENGLSEDEKKIVRGHVLAWHGGQQPNWFFCNWFYYDEANPDWASPETMLKRLDNYIRLMMEKYSQYSDIIYQWDVVNEPVDDYTGQIRNMDDAQKGQWGNIFRRADLQGDERLYAESAWVRQAFASARKWSDVYNADWKLYFNDFQDSNKLYEPKLHQSIKVLKPIYEAGDIDGYGMQGRLAWAAPSIDQLREQIDLGLTVADEIAITESDIRSDFEPNPNYDPNKPTVRVQEGQEEWPEGSCSWSRRANSNGNTFDVCNSPVRRIAEWGDGQNIELAASPEIMKKQADFAADWMDLLISYGDKVSAYQWDGTADNATFNKETGGTLWAGTEGRPEKYSFFAVIGAPARAQLREALALNPGEASLYTPASWEVYDAAKTAANEIVGERVYTLDDVNAVKAATQELNDAYAALQTRLSSLYGEWNGADLSKYTASSSAAVTAALAVAAPVVDDQEAGTEAIAAAYAQLKAAVDGLAVRASDGQLSALRKVVDLGAKSESKPKGTYTEDTLAALVQSLTGARALLDNPADASATQVEDATAQVADAISGLKLVEKAKDNKGDKAKDNKGDKATPDSKTTPGEELSHTGAVSPVVTAGIGALLLALGSFGVYFARRRRS